MKIYKNNINKSFEFETQKTKQRNKIFLFFSQTRYI